MVAPASYQNNLQQFMANRGLPAGAAQRPTSLAAIACSSFQIHSGGFKPLVSSSLHLLRPNPVKEVLQNRFNLIIKCSTYKIQTNFRTKISLSPGLLPSSRCVHGHGRTLSLISRPVGPTRSTFETSMWEGEERDAGADDYGKDENETAALSIGRAAPAQIWLRTIWPYVQLARLEKPRVVAAWPCLWSICLAAPLGTFPNLKIIGLFCLWSFLMGAEMCTVNDILDRNLDGKVERTRSRPLPSGAVTVFQATAFLTLEILLALAVTLPLNKISQLLGAAYILLHFTYPLMKRLTFWPQAYLGFVINFSQLVGWAAIRGNLDLSAILPLYGSGALWFLVIDTIYAHQDKKDDEKAGIKSTALLFGDQTRTILTGFGLGTVALLALAGIRCGLGWPFYAGVVAAAAHLTWQIFSVNLDDPADCYSKFSSNTFYGAIVCSAIVFGKFGKFA